MEKNKKDLLTKIKENDSLKKSAYEKKKKKYYN